MSKNITYVFLSGRKKRLDENFKDAEEFFYSYLYFKKKNYNTELIEFSHNKGPINKIIKFADKILRKLTKLPFFMSDILIYQNTKKLLKSDYVVLTSDRIACSILPLLLLNQFRVKKTNFSCVVLGLFQHKDIEGIRKTLQKTLIKIILKTCDNFIFLGKGEFEYAINEHLPYKDKFNFVPFCVDTNFWKIDQGIKNNKDGILFVGNDGNRLYDLVIKLAEEFPKIKFKLITSNIDKKNIKTGNVSLIKGHWQSNMITDSILKKYYQESKLTIIPIRNTLQPSGQSVALQSMANGTPVVISRTDGFWSYDDFVDNKNIFFVTGDTIEIWRNRIQDLYHDEKILNEVSARALKTIQNKFHLEVFHNKMQQIMGV
jgi:glycosyltransferase involved in cell wall biosynthesis